MNPRARRTAKRSRGLALSVAVALFACLPVFAVAPPPPPKAAVPEVPGPAGLFDLPEFHTDPVHMTLAVFGASSSPIGPWSAAATLCAGEHPAWRRGNSKAC